MVTSGDGGSSVKGLLAVLLLCAAVAAFAQPPRLPAPPPLPPPEGAPMTPALKHLISGRGEIVRIMTGFASADGIVWRRDGGLVFTDPKSGEVVRWKSAETGVEIIRSDSGGASGLVLDAEGRVLAAERGARRVSRTDQAGTTTLLDRVDGQPLGGPSDLAFGPDRSLYIADTTSNGGRIVRLSPDGDAKVVVTGLAQASGVAVAASGTALYVSDAGRAELRVYPIDHGQVGAGRHLATITPWKRGVQGRPDGLQVDRDGHIFLAGPGGIWVMDGNGGRLGVMPMPETPSACTFGDADGRTLYIAAESSVYKVRMKVAGVGTKQ
jgi:sugar lactone lactonase YvrE